MSSFEKRMKAVRLRAEKGKTPAFLLRLAGETATPRAFARLLAVVAAGSRGCRNTFIAQIKSRESALSSMTESRFVKGRASAGSRAYFVRCIALRYGCPSPALYIVI